MKPTTTGKETSKLARMIERVRVWWANWKNRRVAKAYKTLTGAMREDVGYANAWQSNIAMPIYDWARLHGRDIAHDEVNEIADGLMAHLFNVKTGGYGRPRIFPPEKHEPPDEPGMYFARQYRHDTHYRYIVLVWGEAPFLSVKAVFDLIHGTKISNEASVIWGPKIEERHVPPGEIQPRSGF